MPDTLSTEESTKAPIIVVGPPATAIGGMSGVVSQMAGLELDGRYRTEIVPITLSADAPESRYRRIVRHVRQLRRLQSAIRRTGAPIVHIHTCSGFSFYRAALDMLAAQRLGCRVVLHVHGAMFDDFHRGAGRMQQRIISWSLARADRVIALSRGWRDTLHAMAPAARIDVIENAVSIPPIVVKHRHDALCRLLFLARMDDWKGVDDLLDACAALKSSGTPFALVLAGPPGTAGDAGGLAKKISSRGLATDVRYAGPVVGSAKEELLSWADVYVQASRHEGLPIALLEALGFGLAIVATTVGAVPEVIRDGQEGLLVSPYRPDRLAEAIRTLILNPARRQEMSLAARDLARARFDVDRFERELLALYDGLHQGEFGRPTPTVGSARVPRAARLPVLD